MYRCAMSARRVTRTSTYGTGRAPQRRCIGLHLILCIVHNTATDRRCARSHSNTSQVKKLAPLTTRSSSLIKVCIGCTAEQYSKTGRTKPSKHLPRTIYQAILAKISSRYQAFEKLLWKPSEDASQNYLLIKCHFQYNKVIPSAQSRQ